MESKNQKNIKALGRAVDMGENLLGKVLINVRKDVSNFEGK